MGAPLQNIRVVDLTTMISGPYATQILGDQGADVIKIEPPEGDLMRRAGPARNGISAAFLLCNRNKRSVVTDLRTDEGKRLLAELLKTADVLVQNFRPGVLDRLGFSEPRVREIKPDIIYVSISGFGDDGPYAHKRAYDHVIQALSGLMHVQNDDGTPRFLGTLLPDKLTAVTAAQAIAAALVGRLKEGRGQHVRVSMYDSTIAWMAPDGMINHTLLGDGISAPVQGGAFKTAYETLDGHIVIIIASDKEWQGFVRASGRQELAKDDRFTDVASRLSHFKELSDVLRETVRSDSTETWLSRLDAEDVPCARVNTLLEALVDPQAIHNELLRETIHPLGGAMRQPRPAAVFTEQVDYLHHPAPTLGEHNAEVMAELGLARL